MDRGGAAGDGAGGVRAYDVTELVSFVPCPGGALQVVPAAAVNAARERHEAELQTRHVCGVIGASAPDMSRLTVAQIKQLHADILRTGKAPT